MRLFGLVFGLGMAVACAPKPVLHGTLPLAAPPASGDLQTEAHRSLSAVDASALADVKKLNRKAGKPAFGLIGGLYQLPQSRPMGAAYVRVRNGQTMDMVEGWVYQDTPAPVGVQPANTLLADALASATSSLLDAGIVWRDVTMADAQRLLAAETGQMMQQQQFVPSRVLPPGVDALISLQQGAGQAGPVYLARVIRVRDGQLLAMATTPAAGVSTIPPLVVQVVRDALRRLVAAKRR